MDYFVSSCLRKWAPWQENQHLCLGDEVCCSIYSGMEIFLNAKILPVKIFTIEPCLANSKHII